jgi:hypothetical protein
MKAATAQQAAAAAAQQVAGRSVCHGLAPRTAVIKQQRQSPGRGDTQHGCLYSKKQPAACILRRDLGEMGGGEGGSCTGCHGCVLIPANVFKFQQMLQL